MDYIMIGAGGTGSHLSGPLYAYLKALEDKDKEWHLFIADGDTVEEKNLIRQNFSAGDIMRNKAAALVERMHDTPHTQAIEVYIGPENIAAKIRDGDVVLIAADNYYVRRLIEQHALTLQNLVVINGGNEAIDGTIQLWVREAGKNLTPRITHMHPEIEAAIDAKQDRSALSCADIAKLPGGEQTIIANMTSATFMLAALYRYHHKYHLTKSEPGITSWTDLSFDHKAGTVLPWDARNTKGWEQDRISPII